MTLRPVAVAKASGYLEVKASDLELKKDMKDIWIDGKITEQHIIHVIMHRNTAL